jgi:hypothetical protein
LGAYLNLKGKRWKRNKIRKLRSNKEVGGHQEMARSQKVKEEIFSRKKSQMLQAWERSSNIRVIGFDNKFVLSFERTVSPQR